MGITIPKQVAEELCRDYREAEAEAEAEVEVEAPPAQPPGKLEPIGAYMDIERVTIAKGETQAVVRVFGGTTIPIDGFWMNFGFRPELAIENVELGEFFKEHTLVDSVRHDDFRFFVGNGNLRVSYQLFKFTRTGIAGFETAVRIPQGTELVRILFSLAPDSQGSYIAEYGSTGGAVSNRPSYYLTSSQREPIRPEVQNGGIVIAG
jgi:hypothetical protein